MESIIGWLAAGTARCDHGVDLAEEVDQSHREEHSADKREDLRFRRPVLRAIERATG